MSFLSNLFNTGTPELFTVIDEKDRKLTQAIELIEKLNENAVKQLNTEVSLRGVLRIQDAIIDDLIDELTIMTEKVEFLAGEVKALAEDLEDSEDVNEVMADELLQAAKVLIDTVTDYGYEVEFEFTEA